MTAIDRPSDLPDLPLDVAVALDTEGSGLHADDGARVSMVTLAWIRPGTRDTVETRAFPFNQGATEWKPGYSGQQSLFDDGPTNLGASEWQALLRWVAARPLVMHNASHDCRAVHAGIDRPGGGWSGVDLMPSVVWDTAIGSREIWPTHPVGLKTSSVRLGVLNPDRWKVVPSYVVQRGGYRHGLEADAEDQLKRYLAKTKPSGRYDLVDLDAMSVYGSLDAELTIRLWQIQQWQLADWEDGAYGIDPERVAGWIARELRKQRVLYAMEQRGMPFNAARCLNAAAQIAAKQREVAALLPFGSHPFTPHNTLNLNHAKRYWFETPQEATGAPRVIPLDTTATGKPKLDAEIVGKLAKRRVPYAAEYHLWKQLDDALSKWYRAYPAMCGEDGRLRQTFNQTSVKSGRTSVSRVNLQAVPNDYQLAGRLPDGCPTIHECIEAERGFSLFSIDLAQAELRVAARWAPCPAMLDLILSGADAHGVTATELFGVSKEDGGWKQYRNVAKRGNFSLIFDVGAKTFQGSLSKIGIEWPLSKIEPMITKWKYELYPEFRKAVFKVMESAEANGYVRLINGRLCWFTADERKFDLHLAFNRFVQASLAELGTEWMLYIEANHPGILVNWVHDACYLHVPHGEEWRVDEVKAEGIRLFTAMFDVPGDCDITLESKGARA